MTVYVIPSYIKSIIMPSLRRRGWFPQLLGGEKSFDPKLGLIETGYEWIKFLQIARKHQKNCIDMAAQNVSNP